MFFKGLTALSGYDVVQSCSDVFFLWGGWLVFEGCDVEGVLGIFECPPTCSFGMSGDASSFGGVPIVMVFCVVIKMYHTSSSLASRNSTAIQRLAGLSKR